MIGKRGRSVQVLAETFEAQVLRNIFKVLIWDKNLNSLKAMELNIFELLSHNDSNLEQT